MNLFSASKEKVINKIVSIPIEIIISNKNPIRLSINNDKIRELSQSIQENGLLQPVLVRKLENGIYELIAGQRRLLACTLANKKEIPAVIVDDSDEKLLLMSLTENLQRLDLNFLEESKGIAILINKYSFTQEEVACSLGKSQSTIANKLRILKLSEKILNLLIENQLTERHARALLRLEDEKSQEAIVNIIIKNELTVNNTEQLIDRFISKENNVSQKKTKDKGDTVYIIKDVRLFDNTISKAIDTMKKSGVDAMSVKKECDEFIEYIVRIPKDKIFIKQTAV